MRFSGMNPKEIVLEFVNTKLEGDIDALQFYSFSGLEGSDFGRTTCGYFDEDDTLLARAMMFLIWENKLPQLTSFDQIGSGQLYRGETINTYNTLFGKESQFREHIEDDDLIAMINFFKQRYVSIGNFMLMPSCSYKNSSINSYRGSSSHWGDYFDKFLFELDKCLQGNIKESDEQLLALVNKNSFYFKDIDRIEMFCEKNYLSSYLVSKQVQLFFEQRLTHEIENTVEAKQKYNVFAINYLNKVDEIINKRSSVIMDIIKEKIK